MEQLLRTAYILEPTLKMKDFLLIDYQLYVVFVFVYKHKCILVEEASGT